MLRHTKATGCVWPPHGLQVLACVLLGSQALISGVCLGPLLPLDYTVAFSVSAGAFQCLVICLGVGLMFTDPTDPTVYLHRRSMKAG